MQPIPPVMLVSEGSTSATSNVRRRLTRKPMCQYHRDNTTVKGTEIGAVFGGGRSTVSAALRRKKEYLHQDNGSRSPTRRFKGKLPDIERALSNWARNRQRQGLPLSDTIIREKACFFADTVGNSDSQLKAKSKSWLEKFKKTNHLMEAQSRHGPIDEGSEGTSNPPSNMHTPGAISPTLTGGVSPAIATLEAKKNEQNLKTEIPDTYDLSNFPRSLHPQNNTSQSSIHKDTAPSTFSVGTTRPPSLSHPLFTPDSACGPRPKNLITSADEASTNFVNTTASDMSSTAPVKRACDNCHTKKVKCDGKENLPCQNCTSAELSCTFNAIRKKRGPKGNRDKFPPDPSFDGRLSAPPSSRTQGLLLPAQVESCLEYFSKHIYPSEPVLDRQQAQEAADGMDRSIEAYCMITALCAYVMIQAHKKPPASVLPRPKMAHLSSVGIDHVLLEESIRVRKGYKHREEHSHMSVLTLWLYSRCAFRLGLVDTAWDCLREAINHAHCLGMHDEKTYTHSSLEASRKQVLYSVLSIAERTYALCDDRSIRLQTTTSRPSLRKVPFDRSIAVGLETRLNIIEIIDDEFINAWKQARSDCTDFSWIAQLDEQLSKVVPGDPTCTKGQSIKVHITKVWLHSKIWEWSSPRCPLHERESFYHSLISPSTGRGIAHSFRSISTLLLKQDVSTLEIGLTAQLCDIRRHLPRTQDLSLPSASLNNLLLSAFEGLMRRLIPLDPQLECFPEETNTHSSGLDETLLNCMCNSHINGIDQESYEIFKWIWSPQ